MRHAELLDIFKAALKAADPADALKRHLSLAGDSLAAGGAAYDLRRFRRTIVAGAGKATAPMAQAVEDVLGSRIDAGIIIVKYGHTRPLEKIVQREASHPLPDEAGVRATAEIRDMLRQADEDTLVLCLFSGGASSLLVAPAAGLTLEDKRETADLLLRAGASIDELNAVRKHLSAVKGGRLAEEAFPASLITLLLSDVIGDRLDVIASGPTVPDGSTFRDAWAVIEKYGLAGRIPHAVRGVLQRGLAGLEPETAKAGHPCFRNAKPVIIAGLNRSLSAAERKAAELGYRTEIVTAELQGEARQAAGFLAQAALRAKTGLKAGERRCLLAGGETTVTVKGSGKGGRNQELALAFAGEIAGTKGIALLSAGTDGTDGPTDAAGAMVDGETFAAARKRGLDPGAWLDNNASYSFFRRFDALTGERTHLITGPTGTNVTDVQIILVE